MFYCLSESSDSLRAYDLSAAQAIAIHSGNGQTGVAGAPLAMPLRARVTDGAGAPVAGVPVRFAVTAGGGSFPEAGGAVQTTSTPSVSGKPPACVFSIPPQPITASFKFFIFYILL
jgi:hypothetical protein